MNGTAAGRLHGDDLLGEILRNMEEGLVRIRQKTIVPSIYRVYLNPADFEPLRHVVPFLAGEIEAALNDRLNQWNRSKLGLAGKLFRKAEAGEYVRVAEAWTVEIHPDLDGKLEPGEIEVYSELGAPKKTEYGAGSLTRRIFPGRPEGAAPEPGTGEATQSAPPASVETETAEETVDTGRTKGRAFAYIRYTDESGEKTFEVTKNQMVVGRGGKAYWVDLRLETLPDVSREHCRIRRDPDTNRFTIEDLSQFGTAVDGKPVGRGAAAELPNRATLSLAGVVDLRWEAV